MFLRVNVRLSVSQRFVLHCALYTALSLFEKVEYPCNDVKLACLVCFRIQILGTIVSLFFFTFLCLHAVFGSSSSQECLLLLIFFLLFPLLLLQSRRRRLLEHASKMSSLGHLLLFAFVYIIPVELVVGLGLTAETAAPSCRHVSVDRGSGMFWIKPSTYLGFPFQAYCDLDTDGGGWMLISTQKPDGQLSTAQPVALGEASSGGVIHSLLLNQKYDNMVLAALATEGKLGYQVLVQENSGPDKDLGLVMVYKLPFGRALHFDGIRVLCVGVRGFCVKPKLDWLLSDGSYVAVQSDTTAVPDFRGIAVRGSDWLGLPSKKRCLYRSNFTQELSLSSASMTGCYFLDHAGATSGSTRCIHEQAYLGVSHWVRELDVLPSCGYSCGAKGYCSNNVCVCLHFYSGIYCEVPPKSCDRSSLSITRGSLGTCGNSSQLAHGASCSISCDPLTTRVGKAYLCTNGVWVGSMACLPALKNKLSNNCALYGAGIPVCWTLPNGNNNGCVYVNSPVPLWANQGIYYSAIASGRCVCVLEAVTGLAKCWDRAAPNSPSAECDPPARFANTRYTVIAASITSGQCALRFNDSAADCWGNLMKTCPTCNYQVFSRKVPENVPLQYLWMGVMATSK